LITTTEGYRARLNVLPIAPSEKSCSISVTCSLKVVFSLNQPALIDLLKQLKLTKMGEEKISLIEVDKQLELRIEILHPPTSLLLAIARK
jgi:hypothetical protein